MKENRLSRFLIIEVLSNIVVITTLSIIYGKVININIFNGLLIGTVLWIKLLNILVHMVYIIILVKLLITLYHSLKTLTVIVSIYSKIDGSGGIELKKSKFKDIDISMMEDIKEALNIKKGRVLFTTVQLISIVILCGFFFIGCYNLYNLI